MREFEGEPQRRNTRDGEPPKKLVILEQEIGRYEAELILLERITDHKRGILQGHIDTCAAKILKHYAQAEARNAKLRESRPSRAKK